MLLIIFLGLFAKLSLVSGECNVGPGVINDFDYAKFSGPRPWYFILHKDHDPENKIGCPNAIFASPTGNTSIINSDIYVPSTNSHHKINGSVTYWNSSGYMEVNHQFSTWSGTYYVIAVEYDSYAIFKHCPLNSDEVLMYVAFRSGRPYLEIVWEVLKKLLQNKLDHGQVSTWITNSCPMLDCQQKE